ncbi:MAG: hypothetical protein M3P84_01670 [Chloroflexota bacterium]|nr:hypothetical protein [Chloroflexota bacterium]
MSPSVALSTPGGPSRTPSPTPTLTPTPTRTPTPVARWTKPKQVSAAKHCSSLTAGIDAASRYHIAAECNGSIRYFTSEAAGRWKATVFAHPANREDLDPQIAFWGDVVYVGYSRIAPSDGCGSTRGRDLGVYFRSRSQPNGAWSVPRRIGEPGDHLQSLRVDGATIHATVTSAEDGLAYYETLTGRTYKRYPLPKVFGPTSLRIGNDGRARIAYSTAGGVGFAVFNGSGFSRARIPGSAEDDQAPSLVLDGGDKAHVLWTRRPPAGGCVTREPNPDDGTYYATNASGKWKTQRIAKDTSDATLQVDAETGRPHVLISRRSGLWYFTTASAGKWTGIRASSKSWPSSPLLRLDPATGTLLAVYIDSPFTTSSRIYALTKP